MKIIFSIFFVLMAYTAPLWAQQAVLLKGRVSDARSGEPLLYANVYLADFTAIGTVTDDEGRFQLSVQQPAGKRLAISALGYETHVILLTEKNTAQPFEIRLANSSLQLEEVVVLAGENPAHVLLRRIIAQKSANNYLKKNPFSAEVYSKVEVDMVGLSPVFTKNPLLKSFDFVFEQMDTVSEDKPFLPSYFAEELKQIYIQDGKWTELPLARKVSNIGNESVIRMINMIHDRFDIYGNWLPIMDKAFAGPFSDFGLANYEYYLLDSAYVEDRWSYKLKFKPRRKQENTFVGECWVDSLSAAVRSVTMRKSPDVNINLLSRVEIESEFRLIDEAGWIPARESMLLEYKVDEKELSPGLIARKSNYFLQASLSSPSGPVRTPDPRMNDLSKLERDEGFWEEKRPTPLLAREAGVYAMVDSIGNSEAFKRFKKLAYVAVSGYLPWGNVEFGPLFSTYSNNAVEGTRLHFGMGSSLNWSKKWWLFGYAAYGADDQRWKYGAHVQWQPSKRPWTTYKLSYKNDLELNFTGSGEINEDNFFSGILRRNIPQKLMYTQQAQAYWERDFEGGWTSKMQLHWKKLEPIAREGIGFPFYFKDALDRVQNTVEAAELEWRMRWAPSDIFVEANFSRIHVGNQDPRPSVEPFYVFGKYGKDTYYHHAGIRIGQWFNLPPTGWVRYHVHAGVITNTLPYLLLHSPAANETYMYAPNTFNTMARYEFVSDTYVDALAVYHLDGFLLNRIPLMRKLKWREVFTFRMAYGGLREKNRLANQLNHYDRDYSDYDKNPIPGEGVYYGGFDRGPLFEVGAGIENIFKVLRVDATWRLNYLNNRYAVPLSLRGAFTFYF